MPNSAAKGGGTEQEAACASADWGQVISNGGPPCFHVEDGRFCFRALRWAGHEDLHFFVSLLDFYKATVTGGSTRIAQPERRVIEQARAWATGSALEGWKPLIDAVRALEAALKGEVGYG